MPFFPPGSSDHFLLPTVIAEPPAAVRDKLAALSIDEPLPQTYAGDMIRLLAQSPYKLFLYWSHARDPFAILGRGFGNTAAQYRMAVRLIDVESSDRSLAEASVFARNHWFSARAGRAYRAEVGLFAPGHPFIRLLTSAEVRTPRASVSEITDDSALFAASAPEFARVLNEAGYTSDALEVTLEAADEASDGTASVTRDVTRQLTGSDLPEGDATLLSEMRALLAALAFGIPRERLQLMVSPALARWLNAVMAEREGALDTARLLDILRATLALEIDDESLLSIEEQEAMRRVARFVVGGSDVQLPTQRPRLLMPSMTPGAAPPTSARPRKL